MEVEKPIEDGIHSMRERFVFAEPNAVIVVERTNSRSMMPFYIKPSSSGDQHPGSEGATAKVVYQHLPITFAKDVSKTL
ncbi:unnamed protein product [Calicophoron daubneyi]|uniref:Uncharacterized protein n=1 Tax=Calicophoron daubneyi TaxID=300641 RepID=A0AAV2T0V0_CALDB